MFIKKIFITFLLFFSISSYAKNIGVINNIQFKGLQHVSQKEALKSIIFNKGKIISQYDVQNSIKALFKTGKFQNIQVIYSNNNITFYVHEKPIISHVVFSGNNIITNKALGSYLKQLSVTEGNVFNPFFINIFTKKIEDFYQNLGRFESHVKVLKKFYKDNTVNLYIIVNEGVTTNINSIKILGIKDFSKDKILSLFKSKDHHVWWNFLDNSLYSREQLNKDLQTLNNFYLNHGYIDFRINDKKIDFIKDKNQVNITINLFEGKKYKISNIFINGNLFPYQLLIEKFITIHTNELYNQEKINNIINEIKIFLSDNGYVNAIVEVHPIVNDKKHTIVLNFYIDIKTRFFVHRIHFIGNKITQDKVLRREIKQKEGKHLNSHLIALGKTSLQKTKYFSNVEVIKKLHSPDSNQVDIFYKVKEQTTGSINVGLGYGMDNGISLNTSLSQDNIFGSGNAVKASVIKNDNQKYADISIHDPYFIFSIQNLNTRFFYNDFKYHFNSIDNMTKTTYGFESSLGFLINNFNTVHLGFGYTHNGIDHKEQNIDSNLQNKYSDLLFFKNSIVNDFTLNYSWIHSTLDYLSFPSSGAKIYISGKNTLPGSDNNFYKFILDAKEYLPLDKKKDFILFSHMHLGLGNIFNKEKLPFYEYFYANNKNNVRGFRINTIGPKNTYNVNNSKECIGYFNNNTCKSIDSIGGNLIFNSNLEIITPIPFIADKYSKSFRTSLFLDLGNIWDTELYDDNNIHVLSFLKNNILNNIYASMGVSLKWFSPIGPLMFSYSLPIQKDNNYQLEPFQFNFGKNW